MYLVGGAVRDELLGRKVAERDWVVVGATPEELLRQGYRQVGREFPVFLHPQTQEEYALARRERKSGAGYRGFVTDAAPTVTLEDDLKRRDLTINAMARSTDGTLIDPHGGRRDLVLLVIDPARLAAELVYEDCYEVGQAFPHIYGPLNLNAVVSVVPFPPLPDGTFALPPL